MIDVFKTIQSKSEGIYKEKGSKFLAFAFPINNVEEALGIVKDFKKIYYDARHVCYAYQLGVEQKEFRSNDDGEPSGTAGRPILGQLHSFDLTNILVIVVRYFGGVLLGTGGLITAYKSATLDALQNAEIIEKIVFKKYEIRFNYLSLNDVMKIIKDNSLEINNQNFDMNCFMQLSIPINVLTKVLLSFENINDILLHELNATN